MNKKGAINTAVMIMLMTSATMSARNYTQSIPSYPHKFVESDTQLNSNYYFVRDLTIGSYGEDVYELQRILNSDEDTVVAKKGEGSYGMETMYFGNLTKEAVIKFQKKYHDEIPIATGYIGKYTRLVLNN